MTSPAELSRIVVAVPVVAASAASILRGSVDELVCLAEVEALDGVGGWYRDFRQTSDEEVCRLLWQASRRDVGSAA